MEDTVKFDAPVASNILLGIGVRRFGRGLLLSNTHTLTKPDAQHQPPRQPCAILITDDTRAHLMPSIMVQHLAWIYKGVTRCMRSGDDEHRRIRSLWRYPPWHTSLAYVGMHTENTRGHGHVL
eukprot:1014500-Pelagomonas_calceolata.AAC.4